MNTAIVIGGGVIGLSAAYHLALKQFGRIILLEKGCLGDGSSSRAAGITTGLLWSETGVAVRKTGLRRFREMSRELPGYSFHDEHGCLNLFDPKGWEERSKLLPLYDRLGAPYEVMDGAEIRARWPELHPSRDAIGLHDPQGGFSEPDDYIRAVAEQLNQMGVSVRQGITVRDFCVEGGRVTGIRTDSETIRSDAVICAVHCWSLPLLKSLQLSHPVKNFIHQRYLSAPLPKPWEGPAVNADPYWGYVRPARGGRLLLGLETQERLEWPVLSPKFEMHEVTGPPEELLRQGVHRIESLLPLVSNVTWTEQKVGLISFSMDGEPVLGPVESLPGLYLASAFHSGGFSYNTAAGYYLAEWLVEGQPSLDLSAFSPDRFDSMETADHLATRVPQSQAVRRRH